MHLVVPPGGSFREPRRIELGPGVLTIGRAASCEVRIDVPGVDDEHAKISEVEIVAVGADCAVGDVPLDAGQRRLVMPGDEIQIGSVVIALEGQDPSLLPGQALTVPRVRVVEGQNTGKELVLYQENHEYVIGRSPKADLVLEDREVSREHLKVVRRAYSVYLFDHASTRGSWLGRSAVYQGSRIEWDRPRMLKVGATVLSLDLPDFGRRARPVAVPSAPMTPPPRVRGETQGAPVPPAPIPANVRSGVGVDLRLPPASVVAYHYEARPGGPPPGGPPSQVSGPPFAPSVQGPPVTSSLPPAVPPSVSAYASVPPPSARSSSGARTAWKKSGPTIGRTSGLLLLTLAGLAILVALFVVFSFME